MKKLFLTVSVALFSVTCWADTSTPAGKIVKIGTDWGKASTYFTVSGVTTVEGCSENDYRIVVSLDNPMHDHIFSLATTAFVAEKNVVFRISGCTDNNKMSGIAMSIQ